MSHYVLLMRYHSDGVKAAQSDPKALLQIHEALERWEAKVISSHVLLGEWDQCTIIEAPDNFKAYRATLAQEFGTTGATEILPAIDLPLFERLMSQSGKTGGPHKWQIQWWARLARRALRGYAFDRWSDRYFQPFNVTGAEKLDTLEGPCIVVGNLSLIHISEPTRPY